MEDTNQVINKTLQTAAFSFARWRESFLKKILSGAVIVGFISALFGSLDIYKNGDSAQKIVLPVIYIGAWLVLLVIRLLRRPYWLKAGTFVLIIYGLGVASLIETGMRGDACLFFLAFAILTALLFSPKAGIGSALLSLLTIGVVAGLLFSGRLNLMSKVVTIGSVDLWVTATLTLFLMDVILLTGLTIFLGEFNAAQARTRQVLEDLARERDLLEQRVQERTAQLTATNQELESFSYSVSHDLRAPLRNIDGFINVLSEEYENALDETGRKYLSRIRSSGQKMQLLIDALLKLSGVARTPIQVSNVDLCALADDVEAELCSAFPERQVNFIHPPSIMVQADANLMRIVMDNLTRNAWKFTGLCKEARIELGSFEQEGNPVYFIKDNGAGFDMAYADKLFGSFQRLHSSSEFEGTGIGLAIVKRIIHRHGGRVWAEGAIDQGATFYFTLG